jgi:Domain of unknown function (DUF932)
MRRWMRHAVGLRRSEGATHILSATPLPSPMDWRPAERLQTGPATPLAAHIASLTVGGTDRVDLNIAALNSHDGTSAFRILVTPVPVVREHPERRAEQPRVVVLDPPHPQRQFRRPDRPRGVEGGRETRPCSSRAWLRLIRPPTAVANVAPRMLTAASATVDHSTSAISHPVLGSRL